MNKNTYNFLKAMPPVSLPTRPTLQVRPDRRRETSIRKRRLRTDRNYLAAPNPAGSKAARRAKRTGGRFHP